MISNVGEIGYFQLNNLFQNKIPFSLLMVDIVDGERSNISRVAALSLGVYLTSDLFFNYLNEMKVTLEHPFILFCQDGEVSLPLAAQMLEKGYKNVYCIKGGWNSLSKDFLK